MKPLPISSNDESKIQITLDYHYQLSQQVILSKILTKKFHGSKIRNSPRILFLFVSHPRFSCYNDLKKKKSRDNYAVRRRPYPKVEQRAVLNISAAGR